MHLRRIEVRDFRKISHRVVEGLTDGLNVLVGDNEAGKSTLLAALRAVFFERHTLSGRLADAMLPYGSAVRPEIAVDFEIGGAAWHLRKAFAQRAEAELTGPGTRLTGTAVEDKLAALLDFSPPGRGGSKPEEHHGTHGLLWVEQGTRETLGVGGGRNTLAAALEREVGQVTGGDRGRALLAAAAERRDRFWTRTDKPRGDYKDLHETIEGLEGERDGLDRHRRELATRIARLGEVTDMLGRHDRDDRLAVAIQKARSAQAALAAAEALDGAATQAAARREAADRDRIVADERRTRRAELISSVTAARTTSEAATRDAEDAEAVARHQEAQARASEARIAAARQALVGAETRTRAFAEALQRRQGLAAFERQAAHVAHVLREDEARRAALAKAAAVTLDRDALVKLTKLERVAETARAEARAAAVQIGFEPSAFQAIAIDGAAQDPATPISLARDTVLDLEGFGRLTIRPGGGAAELWRKSEAAVRHLQIALSQAGVPNLAEAQATVEAKTTAQTEAASIAKALATLAPQGAEALRQALDTERARLAQPLSEAAAALLDSADPGRIAEAQQAERDARALVEAAGQDDKTASAAHQRALLDATRFGERRANALQRRDTLAAELARARAEVDDDLLAARLAQAEAALAAAQGAEAAARLALAAADPEDARLVLERAERAEREIRADIATLDRERRDILAELRGTGQDGLDERVGEIDGLLERERKRLAAMDVEAAAARMLHEALQEAQRDAKDRWVKPVRDRAAPYLKLMTPGSDIDIDEQTLELTSFSRGGVPEPIAGLSMGAREQVAVITRLALADVLREAGHPAVVILDDALVNTDEARLERMHNVLTRAARHLQILILTCRERDFIGLGKVHRI